MFKHFLFPTDGSPRVEHAIRHAMELARLMGAQVTAVHVSPFHATHGAHGGDGGEGDSAARVGRILSFVRSAADERDVPCETLQEHHDDVFRAIVKVAWERSCDLIVMPAADGPGESGVPLGSKTHRVLTHSGIPVLVWH